VSTPRPDWTKPEKILNLQGTTFSDGATTTKLKVDDLVTKIQKMQAKKTEYVERLAKWEEEQARAGNKPSDKQKQQNKKYSTTLGTGPKVPKYLSFDGKVTTTLNRPQPLSQPASRSLSQSAAQS
jgi:hypothetical protein